VSGIIHLISGRDLSGRPTMCAALHRCAARRAERIVSLGAGLSGAAATIPMPAGRIGLAARGLDAWAVRHMSPDDVIVAWDTLAMCVAAETGQRVVAALDGVHHGGTIDRCARLLVQSGDVPLSGASAATAQRLGGTQVSGDGPLLPLEGRSLPEGDEVRVSIAAEPYGVGIMLPMIGILGRLHLLGMPLNVHIVGEPADAPHGCVMLAGIGLDNVTVSTMAECPRQVGEVVLLPDQLDRSGLVAAVAPAIMMWSRGADVLVPEGHAAQPQLEGQPGVLVMRPGHTDEVVRWISGRRDQDVAARRALVDAWRLDADQSLDATITAPCSSTSR